MTALVGCPWAAPPTLTSPPPAVSPILCVGGVLLLGDAIKAVKPYFGQGANSALEDVAVLGRCLDAAADDPAAAAAAFTAARAEDARALVRISRSFDGAGRLGTARLPYSLLTVAVVTMTTAVRWP